MNTFYIERECEDRSTGLTWTFINDQPTADKALEVAEMLRAKYPDRAYRVIEVLDA